MAHITNIASAKFTSLAYVANTANTSADTGDTLGGLAYTAVGNVREFPSLGTPSNIVNVPVYGQATSSQVQGQADAPTLEFTLNYVPADHAALDTLRKNGTRCAFRVRIMDADVASPGDDDAFADFYFFGTVASFEITPSLSDALQATMALTIDGDFAGPYSLVAGSFALPA